MSDTKGITTVGTHETIEDFYAGEYGETLVVRSQGELWLAWESEDGEWYAIRPRNEEDPKGPDEDIVRPIGPMLLDRLAFPITVASAVDALTPGPDYAKAYSNAMWSVFPDRMGGA